MTTNAMTTAQPEACCAATKTAEQIITVTPPADIFETQSDYRVVADVPGTPLSGIQVRLDDDTLYIEGHMAPRPLEGAFRRTKEQVKFSRSFTVHGEIDREKISADLRQGTLTVTLPKAEKAQPKSIPVSVS